LDPSSFLAGHFSIMVKDVLSRRNDGWRNEAKIKFHPVDHPNNIQRWESQNLNPPKAMMVPPLIPYRFFLLLLRMICFAFKC